MATGDSHDFGAVSRLRGAVFESIAFAASVVGILALALLMSVVTIDAFGLDAADDGWLLTYLFVAVVPTLAVWGRSIEDTAFRRRVAALAVGGLPAALLFDLGLAAAGLALPRFGWVLLYALGVAVPVAGAVLVAGSQGQVGGTATGFVGRIVGGTVLGFGLVVLFEVLAPQLWLFVYSLGVLPAAALTAYQHWAPESRLPTLRIPVALAGVVLAVELHRLLVVLVPYWAMHVWSLALPVAGVLGLVVARDRSRRTGIQAAGLAATVLVAGSLAVGTLGVPPSYALLVLLGLVPAGKYAGERVATHPERLGLLPPVLLVVGAAVAALVVGTLGFSGPEPWLDWGFLTGVRSSPAEQAGFYPAIVGSALIISLVAVLSFAFGVGTALFLEEYTADEGLVGTLTRLLQVNIANLAAVPSVVYGLLGLGLFANLLGFGLGTVLTAGLTLSLLILPITIISAQEALRAVPDDLRRGSDAMGATRWQTTKNVVIPEALPGIFTGTILALGRAIGETAPLVLIGTAGTVTTAPSDLADTVSAMPIQLFTWYSRPGAFREGVVPAGVVTLLLVLLVMNGTAIVLRNRYEQSGS